MSVNPNNLGESDSDHDMKDIPSPKSKNGKSLMISDDLEHDQENSLSLKSMQRGKRKVDDAGDEGNQDLMESKKLGKMPKVDDMQEEGNQQLMESKKRGKMPKIDDEDDPDIPSSLSKPSDSNKLLVNMEVDDPKVKHDEMTDEEMRHWLVNDVYQDDDDNSSKDMDVVKALSSPVEEGNHGSDHEIGREDSVEESRSEDDSGDGSSSSGEEDDSEDDNVSEDEEDDDDENNVVLADDGENVGLADDGDNNVGLAEDDTEDDDVSEDEESSEEESSSSEEDSEEESGLDEKDSESEDVFVEIMTVSSDEDCRPNNEYSDMESSTRKPSNGDEKSGEDDKTEKVETIITKEDSGEEHTCSNEIPCEHQGSDGGPKGGLGCGEGTSKAGSGEGTSNAGSGEGTSKAKMCIICEQVVNFWPSVFCEHRFHLGTCWKENKCLMCGHPFPPTN